MKRELKYNLNKYLEINTIKSKVLIILVFITLISIILFFLIFKIDNIENITGKISCSQEKSIIEFYHYGISEKYTHIKLHGKNYKIIDLKYSDLELDNANNIFQEVSIIIDGYECRNNEIVEVGLYKNKEKLIKKIYRIIVER